MVSMVYCTDPLGCALHLAALAIDDGGGSPFRVGAGTGTVALAKRRVAQGKTRLRAASSFQRTFFSKFPLSQKCLLSYHYYDIGGKYDDEGNEMLSLQLDYSPKAQRDRICSMSAT